MSSVDCLLEQIKAIYDKLDAANAALKQYEETVLLVEAKNSELKARIYLANARKELRFREEVESQQKAERLEKLQKIVSALSTRIRRYREMISNIKDDNSRMMREVRKIPYEEDEEKDAPRKIRFPFKKILAVMVRNRDSFVRVPSHNTVLGADRGAS